ncbi:hypothetical protein [Yersinia enterocolitica]|uniref:hypothetical protein n=1 Tax=Yersinia enterocolitica TaxID=630 RepID=UPI0032F49669|nr:hypothetical protein [Yersinia enterocolitica]HDL7464967.1 hypothetical protein [Yersinia enterocolitica]
MFQDDIFKNRISDALKEKVSPNVDTRGFFSRGVYEAIRILENLKAAPSSHAMKSKERKLKGILSEYWHVHISEDSKTRTFNNIDKKSGSYPPSKSVTDEALLTKTTHVALKKFAERNNIHPKDNDIESIISAIVYKNEHLLKRKMTVQEIKTISQEISGVLAIEIKIIFEKKNSSSGDWLIYWKDNNDVNYYLDALPHIDSSDLMAQKELEISLKKTLLSFSI